MARPKKVSTENEESLRIKELAKILFPAKYPRFTGKRYTSIICAKKLSAFIKAHEERNKTYIKLAKELLFQIVSRVGGGPGDTAFVSALLFELRGLYAILQFTTPLAARALLKEIHMFLGNEKKTHTKK